MLFLLLNHVIIVLFIVFIYLCYKIKESYSFNKKIEFEKFWFYFIILLFTLYIYISFILIPKI